MARREHPEDFNAFGYDPRGQVANMTGLAFGENWRPNQQQIPRYSGPGLQVAPPRYGPPADYQRPHLSDNFVPHLPHTGYLGALQYQRHEGPWAHYPGYPMQALPPPPPHAPLVHPYHRHYPGPLGPPSQQAAPPNSQQGHEESRERSKHEVRPGGMCQCNFK
jgi:hypothetical protein